MLNDHRYRLELTNELHARPFQALESPGRLLCLAFKPEKEAARRDETLDRAHLLTLLDKHGASHPPPDAKQHTADLGRFALKWESHTEFVSYTLYESGPSDQLFEGRLLTLLSEEWISSAPGSVLAAIQCEVIEEAEAPARALLADRMGRHFDPQSVAAASILDGAAFAMGDFRIHEMGLSRFAVVLTGETGPRRIGRACQRLLEIEIYRSMAMLALPIARRVSRRLNEIEREMADLAADATLVGEGRQSDATILAALTTLSAEIEAMSAGSAFRFGAAGAYESIVHERLASLNETSLSGRQMFGEFMMRRFDPAMRTIHAAEGRLTALSVRAARIAELLRTRVNVTLEEQNQNLLESMDRRAALQLRLQETVEGLSVVAISYYAVSLGAYLVAPVAGLAGVGRSTLVALLTVPVVLAVWWFARRIRRRIARRSD